MMERVQAWKTIKFYPYPRPLTPFKASTLIHSAREIRESLIPGGPMPGYTLEELEAVIAMMSKHIEKLKRAENRSFRLGMEASWLAIKQWRIALTALLSEAEIAARMLRAGQKLASSRQACLVHGRASKLLSSMEEYGQVALSSRYLLVNLIEIMKTLCYST